DTPPTSPPDALVLNATTSGTIVSFRAEHGIRFLSVAGVPTCALPISSSPNLTEFLYDPSNTNVFLGGNATISDVGPFVLTKTGRSEERRVGKDCGTRRYGYQLSDIATGPAAISPGGAGGETIDGNLAT